MATRIGLLLLCAGMLGAGTRALADERAGHPEHEGRGRGHPSHHRRWVPEFDPAAVGVIAAVVAGGGILLARRRNRN